MTAKTTVTIPVLRTSPSADSSSEDQVGEPASLRAMVNRVTQDHIHNLPIDIHSLRRAIGAVDELRNVIQDEATKFAGLVPETIAVSFSVSTSGGVALLGAQANREAVATFELTLKFADSTSAGIERGLR